MSPEEERLFDQEVEASLARRRRRLRRSLLNVVIASCAGGTFVLTLLLYLRPA
jgi:hypothetical protein